jgi:hypothetical protein
MIAPGCRERPEKTAQPSSLIGHKECELWQFVTILPMLTRGVPTHYGDHEPTGENRQFLAGQNAPFSKNLPVFSWSRVDPKLDIRRFIGNNTLELIVLPAFRQVLLAKCFGWRQRE